MTTTVPKVGTGRPRGGGNSPREARERFLDAAEQCFSRRGITATTMSDIATEANASRTLLYRHFAGRDAVVVGVLSRITSRYLIEFDQLLKTCATLEEMLVEGMAFVVEATRSNRVLARVFRGQGESIAGEIVGSTDVIRTQTRAFAQAVFEKFPDAADNLTPGATVDDVIEHLMFVGLGLIRGFGSISDDPTRLRTYLRTFAVSPISKDDR